MMSCYWIAFAKDLAVWKDRLSSNKSAGSIEFFDACKLKSTVQDAGEAPAKRGDGSSAMDGNAYWSQFLIHDGSTDEVLDSSLIDDSNTAEIDSLLS